MKSPKMPSGSELAGSLYEAAKAGHEQVVQMLLKADADHDEQRRDGEGKTALQAVRKVILAWSGKNQHPFVKLDLTGFRRTAELLENAK